MRKEFDGDNLRKRLNMIMDERRQTRNAFSKSVGIGNSNFNRKMNGDQPFTTRDFLLIEKATGISREWLEFGTGDMMVSKKDTQCPTDGRLPYYDIDFSLGIDEVYNDEPNVPMRFVSIPGAEKADFCCRTSGDSMQPHLMSGDIIAMKRIEDWTTFLPLNEVYGIVTRNGLRAVKVIKRGSDEEHFMLHSYNKDYEDQEIAKEAIVAVFRVVASARVF